MAKPGNVPTYDLIGANETSDGKRIVLHFKTDSDRIVKFALGFQDVLGLLPLLVQQVQEAAIIQNPKNAGVVFPSEKWNVLPSGDRILLSFDLGNGASLGHTVRLTQARTLIDAISKRAGLEVSVRPKAQRKKPKP